MCVFTLYSEKGASSRYRAYIFKNKLDQNFDVEWHPFWNDEYATQYMHNKKKYIIQIGLQYIGAFIKRVYQLIFLAPKCDIVFIQKGLFPKTRITLLNKLKRSNTRIVFDVDDAIYVDAKSDSSDIIALKADCVICGNQNLKSYYSSFNGNCIVLPTIENTFEYEPYWTDTFKNKVIGWIGSKTTIDNFDLVIDALNEITKKHPEVNVAIISNTALDYTDRIKNSYLVPWKQETYIEEISKFTIGIMPLKDNEINRGKCGFKLIQYLNMKKPVIGSPVGVNCEIIEGNGLTPESTEEWVNAFESLLYNESIYKECVTHIENNFFETYHYGKVTNRLIETLNG